MIYSVWNQSVRQYDYYRSSELQNSANTPKPTHLKEGKLGLTVDQAAWPLPHDAIRIGSGPYARGRIASLRSGSGALGGFDLDTNTVLLLGFGVAAFFLWKHAK